jgi:hypothetical protein
LQGSRTYRHEVVDGSLDDNHVVHQGREEREVGDGVDL